MDKDTLYIDASTLKTIRQEVEYRTIQAAKLGSAMLQLREIEETTQQSIRMSQQKQNAIVVHALKELGIDPDTADVRLSEDGQVLHLVGGKYVPMRRSNGV